MRNIYATFTFLLTPIGNAYWLLLEEAMQSINIHSGQVFILLALYDEEGQSQIELSKTLNLAPPTVNKMIKILIKERYITGRSDENDGRVMRIFLTQKGLDLKKQIEEQWTLIENKLTANFTETEKLILFQLFDKLKQNLINDTK